MRLQAAEKARQSRKPIQTTLSEIVRTPKHDVHKLPSMEQYQAKADSLAAYESLKLSNLGNKATDNWTKKTSLPKNRRSRFIIFDFMTS